MKAILVPVEPHAAMRSILDASVLIASRFDSCIEGLALGPDIPETVPFDLSTNWALLPAKERRDLIERSRQLFEDFMRSCAVPQLQPEGSNGTSCQWAGPHLFADSDIGSFGRVFDLIVIARPGPGDEPPRMATAEAALFESGRPVMLVPPSTPGTIGRRILIAWNGSTETARTVALGMPLLAQAEEVMVLSLEGWGEERPGSKELVSRLRRNGINAEPVVRPLTARTAGEAVLEYAAALHADLIVKGAYTQSRLRQMIFGGATSHILAHARLPVLMAH